jgi:hypothetical protein
MSNVEQGALYQEIGTGTLFTVLDVRVASVRLRQDDPPYDEMDVSCERFRERFAVADSA